MGMKGKRRGRMEQKSGSSQDGELAEELLHDEDVGYEDVRL